MASVNALGRQLVFKIVYYGPGLSGKTSTLQHIHATARPEQILNVSPTASDVSISRQ